MLRHTWYPDHARSVKHFVFLVWTPLTKYFHKILSILFLQKSFDGKRVCWSKFLRGFILKLLSFWQGISTHPILTWDSHLSYLGILKCTFAKVPWKTYLIKWPIQCSSGYGNLLTNHLQTLRISNFRRDGIRMWSKFLNLWGIFLDMFLTPLSNLCPHYSPLKDPSPSVLNDKKKLALYSLVFPCSKSAVEIFACPGVLKESRQWA